MTVPEIEPRASGLKVLCCNAELSLVPKSELLTLNKSRDKKKKSDKQPCLSFNLFYTHTHSLTFVLSDSRLNLFLAATLIEIRT